MTSVEGSIVVAAVGGGGSAGAMTSGVTTVGNAVMEAIVTIAGSITVEGVAACWHRCFRCDLRRPRGCNPGAEAPRTLGIAIPQST